MRVIAGTAKGRILVGPKRGDRSIRPALDKVKGAIFNILGSVEGLRALDLFAGTGSIGIEALSRGAVHVTFVDDSAAAIRIIRKNLEQTGFSGLARLVRQRIPFRLGRLAPFDLIFVDPPYDRRLVNRTLRSLAKENLLAPNGIVVVEHAPREPIADDTGLTLKDRRAYGQTWVSFLTKEPNET